MSNLENATIAIQKSGRLTEGSLEWLNNNAGTDFPITREPFDERREMTDKPTGITVLGYSNGDTLKAVAVEQADFAIAGSDKYYEAAGTTEPNQIGLTCVQPLGFAACRLVLAIPKISPDRWITRVATSYPRLTRAYFAQSRPIPPAIDMYSGGIEMIGRQGKYGAIVDLTGSGRTLELNGLEEVDTVRDCEALLISRASAETTTGVRIEEFCLPEVYDALVSDGFLDALERRLLRRKLYPAASPGSVASRLVNDITGNELRKKMGEEMAERITAQALRDPTEIVAEAADGEFVSMAGLVQACVPWKRVEAELIRRYSELSSYEQQQRYSKAWYKAREKMRTPSLPAAEPIVEVTTNPGYPPLNFWDDVDEGGGGFAH